MRRSTAVFFLGLSFLVLIAGAFSYKATVILLLYVTASSLLLAPPIDWRSFFSLSPLFWGIGLFLVYGAITSFFSLSPARSLKAEAGFMGLLLCFVIMNRAPFGPLLAQDCQKLQKFFSFLFSLTLIVLIEEVITQGKVARLFLHLWGDVSPDHINFKPAAALMTLAMFPVVAFLTTLHHRFIAWVLVLPVLWIGHAVHGQSVLIAVVAGSMAFFLAYLRPLWAVYMGSLGSFFLILSTPAIKFFLFPTSSWSGYLTETSSLYHRFLIWDFTIARIWEKPFFGWGWGMARFIPGASEKAFEDMAFIPVHSHNNSLELWLELGGLGVVLGAGLVSFLFWQLRHFVEQRLYVATYTALLAALLILNSSSYSLWHAWWLAWTGLMCFLPRFLLPLDNCPKIMNLQARTADKQAVN